MNNYTKDLFGDNRYIIPLYYLAEHEVNAYLSELKGELQNYGEYFVNIQQIVDFLRNADICKRYNKIKSYIDFFSRITDDKSQKIVLQWVDELSNLKFRTYQNFINYINKKYDKFERHMNRFIPKIAYEYLDYGTTLVNFNGELPDINE